MTDKERLRRLVKRVKRIPEAGNGGEALLFLLQGIVKRAWPQEQPHAPEQATAGAIPFHKRPHHFRSQLKAFGPIDAATGVRQSRTPAHTGRSK